ncbi:hypothetical protein [Streptomyces sp. NPDC058613]|uniref:hypothetical protein n=1 Tax=unclassified Streptomyces TaxID=2593676 RepID=UPI0036634A90
MITLHTLIAGILSAAAGLSAALYPAVQEHALLLGLATLTTTALHTVLRYRLRAQAVAKVPADDLPALFHAFGHADPGPGPVGQEPTPPVGP